jgi:hypothetical protein
MGLFGKKKKEEKVAKKNNVVPLDGDIGFHQPEEFNNVEFENPISEDLGAKPSPVHQLKAHIEAPVVEKPPGLPKPEPVPEAPKLAKKPFEGDKFQMPPPIDMIPATSFPLFVKVDRYREILETLHDLKLSVSSLKGTIKLQNEIEAKAAENRAMLFDAVNKLDQKIEFMDNEFKKPEGFKENLKAPKTEKEDIKEAVGKLKGQIETVKKELSSLS